MNKTQLVSASLGLALLHGCRTRCRRLSRQIDRINELNSRYTGFTFLKACEVDMSTDVNQYPTVDQHLDLRV